MTEWPRDSTARGSRSVGGRGSPVGFRLTARRVHRWGVAGPTSPHTFQKRRCVGFRGVSVNAPPPSGHTAPEARVSSHALTKTIRRHRRDTEAAVNTQASSLKLHAEETGKSMKQFDSSNFWEAFFIKYTISIRESYGRGFLVKSQIKETFN